MSKTRVMIVDDQVLSRRYFELMISACSQYEVVLSVESAFAADVYLLEKPIDLILMDVLMSDGSNGLDAAETIKRAFPHIKIILVTSMPEQSWMTKAKSIGVESFWYKEAQQIELLEEEVHTKHQIEQHAENDELAACDIHKVLKVAVVDIYPAALCALVIFIKCSVNSLLARPEHPSDHGMINRCAIDYLRLLIFIRFRFRFRLFLYRRSVMDKDIRRPHGKQIRIVDQRYQHQSDDSSEDDFVQRIKPVELEYVKPDIQIEKRITVIEFCRVGCLQENQPCAPRSVDTDSCCQQYRKHPCCGVHSFNVRYLVRLYLPEISVPQCSQIESGKQSHDNKGRDKDLDFCDKLFPEYACVSQIFEPHPVGYVIDQHHNCADDDRYQHDNDRQSFARSFTFTLEFRFLCIHFFVSSKCQLGTPFY